MLILDNKGPTVSGIDRWYGSMIYPTYYHFGLNACKGMNLIQALIF